MQASRHHIVKFGPSVMRSNSLPARCFDSFQCLMASADAGGLLCLCQLKRFRMRLRHLLEAG